VIFAAHTHESALLEFRKGSENALHVTHKFLLNHKSPSRSSWFFNSEESNEPLSSSSGIRLQLQKVGEGDRDVVHEIHVPTCSYRMGTPDIGFGAFHLCKFVPPLLSNVHVG